MLILSNHVPFASGGNRLCYVHPNDPMLCVKPLHFTSQAKAVKKGWIKSRFHSDAYYDENLREFAAYRHLVRAGNEIVWRHIPRHYGFVDTDLGRAAVTQLVLNADGSIARTLLEEIRSGNIPHDALIEFYSFLTDLWRLCNFRSKALHNVVLAQIEDENFRLYIVDGLRSKSFLSFRTKRYAIKYIERFKSRVSDLILSQHN